MRLNWLLLSLAVAASGCTINLGVPVEIVLPARPSGDEARQTYRDACAACHGIEGKGDGPVASSLTSAPTDLTRLSEHHGGLYPRELVVRTIRGDNVIPAHGVREMPVWSQRFAPTGSGATAVASLYALRELQLVVDYVETLQRESPLNQIK